MIKRSFVVSFSCLISFVMLTALGVLVYNVPAAHAAGDYYVDAVNGSDVTGNGSQSDPWQTVSYALSQVIGPDVDIHVAPGVYDTALGESFPIVMEQAVRLLGANHVDTVLYGDGINPVVHFPKTGFYTVTTVISGFKITNGDIGVLVDGRTGTGSSPLIENNWITGNYKGVRNYAVNYQKVAAIFQGNQINYNSYHGVELHGGEGARITSVYSDNQITYNGGDGIYCFTSGPGNNPSEHSLCSIVMSGNFIGFNTGSGHYCSTSYAGACRATIVDNQFVENGGWGVGRKHQVTYLALHNPLFVNNIFVGNAAGGAQFVNNDQPRFVNNTLVSNGPYGIRNGNTTVVNTIVWGHTDDLNIDVTKVSYSNVGDGEYGGVNNNIAEDPQFADPENYDFHILGSSLLVDAGNSAAADVPVADFDGDVRILGLAVDIGADETTADYQLAVQKSAVPTTPVTINEIITYSIDVVNNGPASAAGIRVTDTLPVSTTWAGFASAPNGTITVTDGVLSWTGSVASGMVERLDVTVWVNPFTPLNSQIANTARVRATNGTITASQPVTVTVGPGIYWGVSAQDVSHEDAPPGQPLTYTIRVVNGGNIDAPSVAVTNTLDNRAGFVSADNGGVYSTGRVNWSGLSIDAGETVTLTVFVTTTNPITTGYKMVNLVTISGSGQTQTIPDAVTVFYNPAVAAFDAAPKMAPAPSWVSFYNQSQHAVSFTWDYGDGITSTNTSLTHTHLYTSSSVYSVTLVAANPIYSATITRTRFITIFDAPVADFVGSPKLGTPPLLVTFTNTSQFGDQFIWDYGDGITSTVETLTHTHLYTSAGYYNVSLTAVNEYASDTKIRNGYIGIWDTPVANFVGIPREEAGPFDVYFTSLSQNATWYLWDFGDGQTSLAPNPIHTYWVPGVYTVTLTASNPAASDTLTRSSYITVHQVPIANFSGTPVVGLAPLSVTFTNASIASTSYVWDYGDGTQSTTAAYTHHYSYSNSGIYSVVLTATSPWGSSTMTRNNYIAVYDAPVPDFTAVPLSGVEPLPVQFNNLSQNATSYLWSFGDGGTSTAVSPTHTYLNGGVYTVTLAATNPGGTVYSTQTNYVVVHEAPEPGFTASPRSGFLTLTTIITNTSLFADSYLWDYGDGNTSTTASPVHTHTYTSPGVYDVSLTAINPYSSSTHIETSYIVVYQMPQPVFTADHRYGPVPLSVAFENQSSSANSYTWQFGDGTTSTELSPAHVYTTAGFYDVTLTAENPFASQTVTYTNYITAFNAPVAALSALPRVGAAPLVVTFTNESLFGDTFIWGYGDGQTQVTGEVQHTHTYTMPGTYTVTLTAQNPFDTDTITLTHYIAVRNVITQPAYFVDALEGSDLIGNGSPSAPWQTVSHGLGQVIGPDAEIHVAPGSYDVALGESFPIVMEPGVRLVGSGSDNTVLHGDGATHVVHFPGTAYYTQTTVLRGFMITNGDDGVRLDGRLGTPSTPVIEDNWITANLDGIENHAVNDQRIAAIIRNNRINNNTFNGLYLYSGNNGTFITSQIIDNEITNNGLEGIYCHARGAGSYPDPDNSHCNVTISGNLIAFNVANGFRCRTYYAGECKALVIANHFIGNGGWGVGRSHSGSYLMTNITTFVNNVFAGNSSGGALFINGDRPVFVNNTVVANGPYGVRSGTPTIVNSIVWGHADDLNVAAQYVSYSNIGDGEYGGTNNNISEDPLFVDPSQYDFHIGASSPMIDAGNSGAANLPMYDFEGDVRIHGSAVDIGADEYVPFAFLVAANQTADPDPAVAGAPLTYTVVLTNMGDGPVDLIITDTLPAQVTPSGTVVWNTTLNPGQSWQQQLVVTVQAGYSGSLVNQVEYGIPGVIQETNLLTTTVLVSPAGLSASNSSPTILGAETSFTATVTAGTDVTYTWNFGDGVSGGGPTPTHTYTLTGTFDAWVTATNMVGSQAVSTTVIVVAPVSADFSLSPSGGPAPLPVQFTNLSTGAFDSCLWNFGDGITSTDCANPNHTYTVTGTFTVSLTVNGLGGEDTMVQQSAVSVYEPGAANFTADITNGPAPLQVTFENLSTGDYDTCQWDFGDGGTSTDCADPVYSYAFLGTYSVTLTIDGPGGMDSLTRESFITVYEPEAVFSIFMPVVLGASSSTPAQAMNKAAEAAPVGRPFPSEFASVPRLPSRFNLFSIGEIILNPFSVRNQILPISNKDGEMSESLQQIRCMH
jgi:uncharacterized repeat protein (TIGR01451 family)